MDFITTLDGLHALYGTPGEPALRKVVHHIIPSYRAYLERARFCILSTVGPDGTDGTPRGDEGPVVTILDDATLALPDWQGNQRLDSLRNIVVDGRVSLMFLIPGCKTAIRVNGRAKLTQDADLRSRLAHGTTLPRTVIVIRIDEMYTQCARAIMRSALWSGGDQSAGLPTPGEILAEASSGHVGGAEYDAQWPGRAAKSMW